MTRPAILVLLLAAAAPAAAAPAGTATTATDALPAKLEAMSRAGNAEAAYHLAMLRHLGLQRPKDTARAFKLFMQASDAGDALGAFKVGCYYAGQSEGAVSDDPTKALRYTTIAANAGYDLAQLEVAAHYLHERNDAAALPWLIKAAKQGNPDDGVHHPERAYEYYQSARGMVRARGTTVPDGDATAFATR